MKISDALRAVRDQSGSVDLITYAIPGFFVSMAAEAAWLRRRASQQGPSSADYEMRDTITSLTMGTGSLVVPLIAKSLSKKLAAPSGRWVRRALGVAAAGAATATAIDAYRRSRGVPAGVVPTGTLGSSNPDGQTPPIGMDGTTVTPDAIDGVDRSSRSSGLDEFETPDTPDSLAKVAGTAGASAIVAGGVVATSTWAARTAADRLFEHRILPDLGDGWLGKAVGVAGWDLIYYWNHRFMHQSRFLWAVHVVHHSSERYNLSTALRQPWADALGIFVPYGALALLGVRPDAIEYGRQVNLIYQYWIHTDVIRRIGPLEEVLNTPSHHRVHHGMDQKYLDRNHGSILIIWDRLFGTFQREEEPPTYGLTKNINTFNPLRVAGHEYAEIIGDVAGSDNWRDRLSYVLRGPGWRPAGAGPRVRSAVSAAISLVRR